MTEYSGQVKSHTPEPNGQGLDQGHTNEWPSSIFSSVKWVNSKKIVISAVVLVIKLADKKLYNSLKTQTRGFLLI